MVVVLDGASAIDPVTNPDATEYVDTLGPLIMKLITGTPGIDLRDALAESIRQATERLTLAPGTAPSSTVSIVRWRDATVDLLVLGDSPVIVCFIDDSQETIVQNSQDHIAPELRHLYRQRLAARYGYDDEHRAILAEIQRREAPYRNRQGGYFVAEATPDAAKHAAIRTYPAKKVSLCAIATDGAQHLVEYLGPNWDQLATLDGCALYDLLTKLWRWESTADPDGRQLPRSKRHDDKTIAMVRLD